MKPCIEEVPINLELLVRCLLGGNGGGGWNYENHKTNLKSFGMGKRKGNKLHQNVTPGKVIKPRPIMWELRTLNKAFPLLNWLQYLKESYLEAAEDLTRTDFMDINCLTYFSHFYADGVLLNGGGAIGLVLLLDGWETCGGALSAISGPVLSSLNPKHRFPRLRYRLFYHRCQLLVRFYRSHNPQHSYSSHLK